jgi:hypothetical protein
VSAATDSCSSCCWRHTRRLYSPVTRCIDASATVQASGRRKLLQAPANAAAAARAARQRAARQAAVTPAQLVDALKTRLAAYDEYIAMKAQVASLARLYQVRARCAPSRRMHT